MRGQEVASHSHRRPVVGTEVGNVKLVSCWALLEHQPQPDRSAECYKTQYNIVMAHIVDQRNRGQAMQVSMCTG